MKVGLDARLAAYTRGGIVRYTTELARALRARRGDVQLLTLRSWKDRAACRPSVPLLTPPHHRLERWALPFELARLSLDLVHFPDHVAPRRLGYRSVVTVHDLAFALFPETHTDESRRYYGQLAESLPAASAVIAVSEHTRRDLIRLTGIPASRVTTVHNGVGPAFHPPKDETEQRLEADALRRRYGLPRAFLLTVGTLSPRKNLATLLEALAILRAKGETIPLAVVGEHGWLYDAALGRIDQLGLRGDVHLLGAVGDGDLAALYRSASLFVFPSLYEGFAFPPIEAMASGTLVVASNAGSIPEVLGDAAVLVDPRDPSALACAIEGALHDQHKRDELRARGQARAARFSWDACAQATLDVYRAALRGS